MGASLASPSMHTLLWLPNCWLLRICCVKEQPHTWSVQTKRYTKHTCPHPIYIYIWVVLFQAAKHTECKIWPQGQYKVTSVPGFLIYKIEVSNTVRFDLKSSCFHFPKAGVIGLYHYTWLKCLLLNIVFWNTSGMRALNGARLVAEGRGRI